MGTLGAGMVLGREGPTVQLGDNLGRMVLDVCRLRGAEARHTLLATGAAAGLTAVFNAPLAGILFIIEEMRPQFRYNLISIKAVFIGVINGQYRVSPVQWRTGGHRGRETGLRAGQYLVALFAVRRPFWRGGRSFCLTP